MAAIHIGHGTGVRLMPGMSMDDGCFVLCDFTLCCGGEQGLHAAHHACGGGHPEGKRGGEDGIERGVAEHFGARRDYTAGGSVGAKIRVATTREERCAAPTALGNHFDVVSQA